MEKIKSTYYPERLYGGGRWKHEPYNADDLEHNPPPKIDHVDVCLDSEMYTSTGRLISNIDPVPFQCIPTSIWQEHERQLKMRKVIAHLNKKPFRINWDDVQLFLVMFSLLWFFGRSLWFIITGK